MKNLFFLVVLFCTTTLVAQDTIPTSKAAEYVGKEIWVKGTIASLKLAPEGRSTNYINVDKPYPDAEFTVVISNKYAEEHQLNLNEAKGKKIRVKGVISVYEKDPKKTPQIFNPTQIIIE
ncbi:MAG: hypothetical protein RLZZ231_1127 [Bacteroidota bacterium]|jgi:hypothetical protein